MTSESKVKVIPDKNGWRSIISVLLASDISPNQCLFSAEKDANSSSSKSKSDTLSEEVYKIDKIIEEYLLAPRPGQKKELYYLVVWEGFDEPSWEPASVVSAHYYLGWMRWGLWGVDSYAQAPDHDQIAMDSPLAVADWEADKVVAEAKKMKSKKEISKRAAPNKAPVSALSLTPSQELLWPSCTSSLSSSNHRSGF